MHQSDHLEPPGASFSGYFLEYTVYFTVKRSAPVMLHGR